MVRLYATTCPLRDSSAIRVAKRLRRQKKVGVNAIPGANMDHEFATVVSARRTAN